MGDHRSRSKGLVLIAVLALIVLALLALTARIALSAEGQVSITVRVVSAIRVSGRVASGGAELVRTMVGGHRITYISP